MGIGAPAILFHAISFGRLSEENYPILVLLSSVTFWAMFGLCLASHSRLRRLKTQRRLASDWEILYDAAAWELWFRAFKLN